jgi:uncharacterized spore protein YtfJ
MVDTISDLTSATNQSREQASAMLERIFAAAQPGAVFGQPVVSGSYTVITASEVTSGGGFGSGLGFGPAARPKQAGEEATPVEQKAPIGYGGGMGGGGGAMGRPIAVIVIGPDGVTVKPVFDTSKIVLAGITAGIAAFAGYRRFRRLG